MSKKNKPYTIIRNDEQYDSYCRSVEEMSLEYKEKPSNELLDLMETITLLIELYDNEQMVVEEVNPIDLLKFLMNENELKQKDMAKLLQLSTGHLSDILNRKKGLSKNSIRLLSDIFKVRQDAFNRSYNLNISLKKQKKIVV